MVLVESDEFKKRLTKPESTNNFEDNVFFLFFIFYLRNLQYVTIDLLCLHECDQPLLSPDLFPVQLLLCYANCLSEII